MRPLHDWYASSRTPKDPEPSEPVAFLAAVLRATPLADPQTHADRAFFGLDEPAMRELGSRIPPLAEIAYELLESASVRFERLGALRIGLVYAGTPGVDLPAIAELLGIAGPVMSTTDEPGLFSALHLASQLIRADDASLVLVLCEGPGQVGVCLGSSERAAADDWRMVGLLSGTATGRDAAATGALAALRAALPHLPPRPPPATGSRAAELLEVLADLDHQDRSVLLVDSHGDRAVGLVLSPLEPPSQTDDSPRFLGLSARSLPSLQRLATTVAASLSDRVVFSAFATDAARRPAFEYRMAVPLGRTDEASERLADWAAGRWDAAAWGHVPGLPSSNGAGSNQVVFVFPPAGTQTANAAARLYETEPTFREALNRCDRLARPHLPRALLSVLFPTPGREDEIDDPGYANPVTVAFGWALAELLRGLGVEPAMVVGCGVGELVACAVAGSVDLEEALRLSVERGRLLRGVSEPGRRAVVGATEEQVSLLLAGEEGVDLVAVPRPGRTLVGGRAAAVSRFVERVRLRGIRAAEVDGNPVHSPLVDPVLAEFATAAGAVVYRQGDLPVVSTVTGRLLQHADAAHWVGTMRAPMRFAPAIETAYELGGRTFVELGPRPAMGSAGEQTLRGRGARFLPVVMPGTDDRRHLGEILASLWARGVPVEPGTGRRSFAPVSLPSYRFDHRVLDDGWTDAPPVEDAVVSRQWVVEPPVEDAEITLVPPEEQTSRSDELFELGATKPSSGPQPLRPLDMPSGHLPVGQDEDDMSVDSDPVADITLDDLRYHGPGRQGKPTPPEPTTSERDFLGGQQGPVFREVWVEAPLPEVILEPTLFVLLTDGELGDAVAAVARAAGHRVIRVVTTPGAGEGPASEHETHVVPDPVADDAWMDVIEAVGTLHGPVQLVHLWAAGATEPPDALGWPALAALVNEVIAVGLPVSVHVVTSGVVGGAMPDRQVAGGLWGMAGLVAAETDVFAGIVDLELGEFDPNALFEHLATQAAEGSSSGAFLLRGRRRSRKIVASAAEPQRPEGIDADGTWVLSGDVDQLMLDLASWFVARGVKRLFLVGPTAPPPEVLKSALGLQKRGAACIVVRADASDPKGAETIRQRLSREKKLSGLFLRFQPTPCPLRELDVLTGMARWRQSLDLAAVLTRLVGPTAPVFAWSEARALDGAAGNGVGACVATSLAVSLVHRGTTGAASAMVHTGHHASLPPGESVRLVTGLCALGGQWGVWIP